MKKVQKLIKKLESEKSSKINKKVGKCRKEKKVQK